jgi:RimJ/RimL family protein N-acetyltransferase
MIYREATPEDLGPRNMMMFLEGLREVELGRAGVCPARTLETLTRMISSSSHLVAVSDSGDGLTGVIIGSLSQEPFSEHLFAQMHVWYVRPEFRGSWTGYRLARIYRDWARMVGAKTAYFEVNSGVDNERAGALAKKLGFSHIGDIYKASF